MPLLNLGECEGMTSMLFLIVELSPSVFSKMEWLIVSYFWLPFRLTTGHEVQSDDREFFNADGHVCSCRPSYPNGGEVGGASFG